MTVCRALFAAGTIALAAGCSMAPSAPPLPGLRAAFVVLGVDGQPIARAITADANCPPIEFDGAGQTMDVRAQPATIPARPRFPGAITKPAAFPVLTCEKTIPAGTQRASIANRALPLPKADPQRILVLGDTGCRLLAVAAGWQACNDPVAWPFARVAADAAATKPDLVIHVGDYHYREDPCPLGNAGCAGSPWGYGWDVWDADFFTPGAPLLAAAPWIVIRGNHEACGRAGQGWYRFLDPRPLAPLGTCDDPANDETADYTASYAVPLGAAGSARDTQFLIFDSSAVGLAALAPTNQVYTRYHAQFAQAWDLASRRPNNIFIDHHPILAFATNPMQPDQPYPGNRALQSVMQSFYPTVLFPPSVQTVFSGHNHVFEMVSFSSPHPAQFIFGNGGDWLDVPMKLPLQPGVIPTPGSVIEQIVAHSPFGYVVMDRDGAGWKLLDRDTTGAVTSTCFIKGKRAECHP